MSNISPKHALTAEELDFCKKYAGFGYKNAPEAYRRSHLVRYGREWYEADDPKGDGPPVSKPEAQKRANSLIRLEHIKEYIEMLKRPVGEQARSTLAEQMIFAPDGQSLKAAQEVLRDEDKMGFQDAADLWAQRMCAIGAEVVVPVPGGGETVFPLGSLFPQYAEAMPPSDVIAKTIKSLQGYLAKMDESA